MRERPLLIGSLAVVIAATGFGLLGPLARFAYDAGLGPISFVAWRAGFATVAVAAFAAWRISRGRRFVAPWRLPRRDAAALGIVAVSGFVLNVAMFLAFERTTVALVLLAFYTYPALVAIVAVGRGQERLDAVRATALAVSSGGMILVVAGSLGDVGVVRVDLGGIGLGLVAAVSQTVFVTVSRNAYPALPTEQAMAWILAGTLVSCIVLAAALGDVEGLARPLASAPALTIAVIAGVIAAGIPSTLFLAGIRTIGAMRSGILMLIEPLVGVGLAAILLDEGISPLQAAGGLAILCAAVLLQRSSPDDIQIEPVGTPLARGAERS